AHPGDLRSREIRQRRVGALAEDEQVEPVGTADHGVRLLGDAVDDAVTGRDLVRVAVLPRESGAGEHVEELLLVELDVHGRGLLAWFNARACNTYVARAGGGAE